MVLKREFLGHAERLGRFDEIIRDHQYAAALSRGLKNALVDSRGVSQPRTLGPHWYALTRIAPLAQAPHRDSVARESRRVQRGSLAPPAPHHRRPVPRNARPRGTWTATSTALLIDPASTWLSTRTALSKSWRRRPKHCIRRSKRSAEIRVCGSLCKPPCALSTTEHDRRRDPPTRERR